MLNKKNNAYEKVVQYCGYQERTEQEVRNKLHALGVTQTREKDQFIRALKAENFLNEERYIEAFIRGKVLSRQWGKKKLLITLTNKGLDPTLIQKGLDALADTDYLQSLHKAADRKKRSLAGKDPVLYKQKLTHYLLQKGYEPELVYQVTQQSIPE